MSLILNESLVLAKTRSQDLKSVLKLNCWGSGITDVSLVRQLVNVEVIGLSCNEITSLEDFAYCPKLKELILRKNKIKNISEIAHLQNLPKLTNLWLGENPCCETTHNYRKVVLKALPNLTVLDNIPVTREELQEIEELGNDIYEEIPYESTNSSSAGSGPASASHSAAAGTANFSTSNQTKSNQLSNHLSGTNDASFSAQAGNSQFEQDQMNNSAYNDTLQFCQINTNNNEFQNDTSLLTPSQPNQSQFLNESSYTSFRAAHNNSRSSNVQPSRCLSLQGSVTTLNNSSSNNNNNSSIQNNNNNTMNQNWSLSNNNNNNNHNLLPKGGKSRTANILSAVLCLVKELDYTSCEVVQTALHCRMEDTSQ